MKKVVVALALFASSLGAQAGMITTQDVYSAELRQEISHRLSQTDLVAALAKKGISAQQAADRLDKLTPGELQQLAAHLDELPAGGAGFAEFLLTGFAILVVTDALGYTDIFPFITKPE